MVKNTHPIEETKGNLWACVVCVVVEEGQNPQFGIAVGREPGMYSFDHIILSDGNSVSGVYSYSVETYLGSFVLPLHR